MGVRSRAGAGKVNCRAANRLQILLDRPQQFVILRRSQDIKTLLPVLTKLRPRCASPLRIEQLSGRAGHLFGWILANPFEPGSFEAGPNCSLADRNSPSPSGRTTG